MQMRFSLGRIMFYTISLDLVQDYCYPEDYHVC